VRTTLHVGLLNKKTKEWFNCNISLDVPCFSFNKITAEGRRSPLLPHPLFLSQYANMNRSEKWEDRRIFWTLEKNDQKKRIAWFLSINITRLHSRLCRGPSKARRRFVASRDRMTDGTRSTVQTLAAGKYMAWASYRMEQRRGEGDWIEAKLRQGYPSFVSE
jgi:hypothetical protein